MKFLNGLKKFFLYLWQLPQNIIGLFVILFTRAKKKTSNGITYYFTPYYNFGVSLGNYIIIGKYDFEDTIKHEHGHQIQSLYLGWLYLLIIGLPSAIGNIYSRIKKKDSYWYYHQPWEAWADKLGKVERKY